MIFAFFAQVITFNTSSFDDRTEGHHPLDDLACDGNAYLVFEKSCHQLYDKMRLIVDHLKASPKLTQALKMDRFS